jgi:hypothetical protein
MSKKFLITLVGILLSIFALCNFDFKPSIIEGWNGMDGSRSVTVRKVLQDPKSGRVFSAGTDTVIDSLACGASIGAGTDIDEQLGKMGNPENYRSPQYKERFSKNSNNGYAGPSPYVNPWGQQVTNLPSGGSYTPQQVQSSGREVNPMMGAGEFFQAPPNFQANLSPRFDNNGYGAYINYNRPDQQYLGSPCDPLDADRSGPVSQEGYRRPTRENFSADNSQHRSNPPSCGKGGYGCKGGIDEEYEVPPGYTNGNKNQMYESLPGVVVSNVGDPNGVDNAAVPTGTITLTDDSGHPVQYLTQDRYMFTTKKSRLWGLGDMIRGDIPVTPATYGNFDVFPVIASDVNRGALAAMAGVRALDPDMVKLIGQVTGGNSPVGGAPVMTNQVNSGLASNCTDVTLTAFP